MSIRFRFLACLAVFALSGCAGTPAQAQASGAARDAAVSPPLNHLSLSASASIEVPMDELSVTLAVVREASEAATVQAQMSQVLEAALAEARRQARPGELEVRTGAFSLNPRYAPPPARPAPGYTPSIVGWQGRAELHLEGLDQRAVASLAGRLSGLSVARVGYSRRARRGSAPRRRPPVRPSRVFGSARSPMPSSSACAPTRCGRCRWAWTAGRRPTRRSVAWC